MTFQDFSCAHWKHSKQKAELFAVDKIVISMSFKGTCALVETSNHAFEIRTVGFWSPKITISEANCIVAVERQLGFWNTKSEFVLDSQHYLAATKQGNLFNITYTKADKEILTYKMEIIKNKPIVSFEIKDDNLPELHLLLLLAVGFYSIKNVAIETMSDDFIIAAVA